MNDDEYDRIREALKAEPIEKVIEEFSWPAVQSVLHHMTEERIGEAVPRDPRASAAVGPCLSTETLEELREALELYTATARQALERSGASEEVKDAQQDFAFLARDLLRRPEVGGEIWVRYPRPTISGFEPQTWTRGGPGAILGINFGRVTGVEVGTAGAEDLVVAGDRLEFTVPPNALHGGVRLLPSGIAPGRGVEPPSVVDRVVQGRK